MEQNVNAELVEKPDTLPWMEDLEGVIETFAFSGPSIDSTLTLEGGTT